jgi:23S rRNA-/tRNA-specific pseudouridylate synthase
MQIVSRRIVGNWRTFNTVMSNLSSITEESYRPNRTQLDLGADSANRLSPQNINDVIPSILCSDENYCVIDKPADVRMDGQFDVTVDKLVAKWLSVDIKKLKWVHQLDYATSGALCIALNRQAAGAACSAFEHRLVKKEYLAILQGHLTLDKWPIHNQPLQKRDYVNMAHRKRRKLALNQDVSSSITSNVSKTWQTEIMKRNLETCLSQFEKLNHENSHFKGFLDSQANWKADYDRLKSHTFDDFMKSAKSRKLLRKILQLNNMEVELVDSSYETYTKTIKSSTTENDTQLTSADHGYPTSTETSFNNNVNEVRKEESDGDEENGSICSEIFAADTPPVYRLTETSDFLIVNIPIAEIKDDFRMEAGHSTNPGKVSATEVHIIEHGMYQGNPITKVLFKPLTGRRHQLRIHSLCLGFPIVGDYTYNSFHRDAILKSLEESNTAYSTSIAERMMLHAHILRIPLPKRGEGKCTNEFRNAIIAKAKKEGEEYYVVDVQAPDPFPIRDGVLVPLVPLYVNNRKTAD